MNPEFLTTRWRRAGGGGLFVLLLGLLSGCGIEQYIYLEPPTRAIVASDDTLRYKITVPDQSQYFDEYLIYYKIYPSTSTAENPLIASDTAVIQNANENSPDNLESVLRNRSFRSVSYGADNQDLSSIVEEPNPLKASTSFSFYMEFNLAASNSKYPYLEMENGARYRILRNKNLSNPSLETEQRDFLYSAVKSSYPDGTVEDRRPDDVVAIQSYSYAHVLLFIVASGHDENFSLLHSTALEISSFILGN